MKGQEIIPESTPKKIQDIVAEMIRPRTIMAEVVEQWEDEQVREEEPELVFQ